MPRAWIRLPAAMSGEVTYRLAVVDDAAQASQMHRTSWREAYSPLVDIERLHELLDDADFQSRHELQWATMVRDGAPRMLAVAEGKIVGFAAAGPNRDEPAPHEQELYAIYLLAEWQGRGIADELMARSIGEVPASLWVLRDNTRAQAFYRRHGFRPDGEEKVWQTMGVPEVRMVRP